MKHAMLLDCTLRDGAYLIDKKFGNNTIKGIIGGLINSRVDIIEIGFLQDEGFGDGKTIYKNSKDAKRFIPQDKKNCLFSVLADCSRYSICNLDECRNDSIDAIRECFFKEEIVSAIDNCKIIKNKGYKCFVQPVDILGYSDLELIELIHAVNDIEPYCFSIVDTFGSMYPDDLRRIFEIVDHNLISTCKIGFHSHNNLQLSNALSQEFVSMSYGKREVIIDGTICGMGRGAGNTPTELIAQYLVDKRKYNYDIDALLDVIDGYMDNIQSRCRWGYSTPLFIAGCYGAHVNNVSYLTQKNSIKSKDMRYILNKLGDKARKRYDYDLLEKIYLEYLSSDIDDSDSMIELDNILKNKDILVIAPGKTIVDYREDVDKYIEEKKPLIISVNFLPQNIETDYIYMSNYKRYSYWMEDDKFKGKRKIIASNLKQSSSCNEIVVSFNKLLKGGWKNIDNSMLMLLRLLDNFDTNSIAIAGFDGYNSEDILKPNYALEEMELFNVRDNSNQLNEEIREMLKEYSETRKKDTLITFITKSKFENVFE